MTNITTQISLTNHSVSMENAAVDEISKLKSQKEQLKKVSQEFESLFISKMLEVMDKTVERDEGAFGLGGGDYLKNFKSYFHMELGREMASNDSTSFGFAKQIYQQMEKYVQNDKIGEII